MANQQSGVEGLACGIDTPAAITDPDDALPPVKTSKTTFTFSPTTSATVTTTISVSDNQRKKPKKNYVRPKDRLHGLKHKMQRQMTAPFTKHINVLIEDFLKEAELDPDRAETSVVKWALPQINAFSELLDTCFDTNGCQNLIHRQIGGLQKMYLAVKTELNTMKTHCLKYQELLSKNNIPHEVFLGANSTQQDRVEETQNPAPTLPKLINERDSVEGTEGISLDVVDYDSEILPGLHEKITVPTGWERVKDLDVGSTVPESNVVTPVAVLPILLHLNWVPKPSHFDWPLKAPESLYSFPFPPGEHFNPPTSRYDDRHFNLAIFGDSCLNRFKPFLKKHPIDHLDRSNHIIEAVSGASAGQIVGRHTDWKTLDRFFEEGQHNKTGNPVSRQWDIHSFTDHIWWVGRNDLSDSPRNGRRSETGHWLAHKFYEQAKKLNRYNKNIRIYIVSPTPSPDDVSMNKVERFMDSMAELFEGDKNERFPISNIVSVIEYGYGPESHKIKWETDRIHPRTNDIYTNTFLWELINAVTSFGSANKLGRRPFTNFDVPWEGWSHYWQIDDAGRNGKKVYR